MDFFDKTNLYHDYLSHLTALCNANDSVAEWLRSQYCLSDLSATVELDILITIGPGILIKLLELI